MTPVTNVMLLQSKLDRSNKYVLYVTDEQDALNKIGSSVISSSFITLQNCYWQRDNFTIRAPYNINDLRKYNYCVYRNGGDSNKKTIFAFIDSLVYVNDELTYINITTDSWMTFSYECNFEDSLMERCHPEPEEEAADNRKQLNYFNEPVSPMMITNFKELPLEGDDIIYYTSMVNISGTTGLAANIGSYLTAYVQYIKYQYTLNQGGVGDWVNWWNNLESDTIVIGGINQRPTFGLKADDSTGMNSINLLFKWVQQCDLSSMLVSCYIVPAGLNDDKKGQLVNNVKYEFSDTDVSETMNWYRNDENISWNKIYYSPQFNKLGFRFCGREVEVPFENIESPLILNSGAMTLDFEIISNWSEDGCAYMKPKFLINNDEFILAGPSWDKLSINVYSGNTIGLMLDQFNARMNRASKIGGAITTGLGIAAGMIGASPAIGNYLAAQAGEVTRDQYLPPSLESLRQYSEPYYKAGSTIAKIGGGAMMLNESLKRSLQPVQAIEIPSGATTIGTNSNSLMGLKATQPLAGFYHSYPISSSMQNLNKFFSTWGYDQGGLLHKININPGSLYFKYYKTVDSNVSGSVPQSNLEEIKTMFNNGVFIFKEASKYKDFSTVMDNHY